MLKNFYMKGSILYTVLYTLLLFLFIYFFCLTIHAVNHSIQVRGDLPPRTYGCELSLVWLHSSFVQLPVDGHLGIPPFCYPK